MQGSGRILVRPTELLIAGGNQVTCVHMLLPDVHTVFGVDFSGARLAGENTWIARVEPSGRPDRPPFVLAALDRLSTLAGTAERGPTLRALVDLVLGSRSALWGFDFPFGLPIELFAPESPWPEQLAFLAGWGDDAYECGLECVRRTRALADDRSVAHRSALHVRRQTDVDARAPFDPFHYRIIYQTFFGMRDVLGPLRSTRRTAVLPFQYTKLRTADRVLVECCPASVLKRWRLPHQNYKQPGGGPLSRKRRLTRHAILGGLAPLVRIPDRERLRLMRNPGGDALDAVIAAVGAGLAMPAVDHRAVARHPRYPREGHLFF